MIEIEQTGSPIRRHHSQRQTLIGLGLNRIGRIAYVPDTPEVRGMVACSVQDSQRTRTLDSHERNGLRPIKIASIRGSTPLNAVLHEKPTLRAD